MSILLEFSLAPFDKGVSLGPYVSKTLDIIDRSGVPYRLNPMGTVIEGSWEDCLRVVSECFDQMARDCERVSCSIKIDYHRGRDGRLESKIESVEKRLGRSLKT